MTEPIGPGAFVAVVGASGVGKDALLSYARERSGPRVGFPRRTITRPPGPGEDHDPVTEEQFALARDDGAFALCWQAHGLRYGIPGSVDAEIGDASRHANHAARAWQQSGTIGRHQISLKWKRRLGRA